MVSYNIVSKVMTIVSVQAQIINILRKEDVVYG